MDIPTLQKERDKHLTSFFKLGLQIAIIFAVPAAIAVLAGKQLDALWETGRLVTGIMLVGAFITSWVLVFKKYNKLNKQVKDIEDKIRILREQEKATSVKED